MMRLLMLGIVIAAWAIFSARSEAQTASYRQCNGVTYGDNVQFYNITTRNITCTYARRLAQEWEDVSPLAAGKTRLRGFDCRARQTGFTLDVRCTGDIYVVHFHVTAED